jgi:arylformamidase
MSDWIDVTRTLSNGIIRWPEDPPFKWQRNRDILGPGTSNLSEMSTSVHIGTHIDAPLHYIADGKDISEVPLEKLCGPATVVHVQAPRDIVVADLEAAKIPKGDSVLFRTANEALWDKAEFDENFYAISADAAMWLVDQEVCAVGVDYLSVDAFNSTDSPVHYALLGNGILVIESLDLSKVEPGRYEMVALPLKIAGSEAAPARVIIRPWTR